MQPLISHTPRTPVNPLRVGVFVSGNGSNLQALINSSQASGSPFKIDLVISNIENAFALTRAQNYQIPTRTISHRNFSSRLEFEKKLVEQCIDYRVEIVVLAGFMRVLSSYFLKYFPNRVLNVHPALCPAFPGLHAAQQAIARGVKYTGCTVHLVNEGVDEGPILAQSVVPVHANDDEVSLQQRIQLEEHVLLPQVVCAIANGSLHQIGNRFIMRTT